MKVFCSIFSVYILVLSWQPCQDLAEKINACSGEVREIAAHLHNADETEPQGDDCSPFCICSCCQISAAHNFSFVRVTRETAGQLQSNVKIEYQNPYTKTYKTSVWQPPKA